MKNQITLARLAVINAEKALESFKLVRLVLNAAGRSLDAEEAAVQDQLEGAVNDARCILSQWESEYLHA